MGFSFLNYFFCFWRERKKDCLPMVVSYFLPLSWSLTYNFYLVKLWHHVNDDAAYCFLLFINTNVAMLARAWQSAATLFFLSHTHKHTHTQSIHTYIYTHIHKTASHNCLLWVWGNGEYIHSVLLLVLTPVTVSGNVEHILCTSFADSVTVRLWEVLYRVLVLCSSEGMDSIVIYFFQLWGNSKYYAL